MPGIARCERHEQRRERERERDPTAVNATAPASGVNTNFTVKGRLTINGANTGIGNQNVTPLKYNATTKTYSPVKTVKTSSTSTVGAYTFTVKEMKAGTYYYRAPIRARRRICRKRMRRSLL